ncbi:MAG: ankyrin repeat domain-containing protein [Vicinamibacterales bacterium]
MAVLVLLLALAGGQPAAGVDAPDGDGLTALMRAAARGDAAAVTGLLGKGADVNRQAAGTRLTALMCAGYFGRDDVVKTLLARGARADLKDASGASAADWASAGSRAATEALLAKAGSQLNPFLNVGVMPFALMDKAAGRVP